MAEPSDDLVRPTFSRGAELDAERAAAEDVATGLRPWFDGDARELRVRDDVHEAGEVTNGTVTAVAWRYRATPRRDVWGVAAGGPIDIDGVSFVDLERGQFARYIDWHGVFEQLGVSAAGRVSHEPDTT